MISLIRIDDRLIHGQVMAVWVRALDITHILIIDDQVAGEPFTQKIMQLAMPLTIRLTVATLQLGAAELKTAASDSTHTLVLLKSVDAAVRLHDVYAYRDLDIGGIGMEPGRRLVWRSIAASSNELQRLQSLRDSGVDVYWQMIPADEKRRLIIAD